MKTINFLKENGIDVDAGIELLGDEEVYNSMLEEFQRNFVKKLDDIKKSYEEADMPNYAIYVHSLKSDSKYFGFTKLAEIAAAHEEQAKANNMLYVRNNYNALISEAENINNIMSDYFNDEDEKATEKLEEEAKKLEEESKNTEEKFKHVEEPVPDKKEEVLEESNSDVKNVSDEIETLDESDTGEEPETLYKEDIILVADDSEIIRAFVKKLFDIPYELQFASNGEEAIDIIKQHENDNKIGAILLDLNMPKVDGYGVLEYIKEHDLVDKMPVTIVSGEQDKTAVAKAFDYEIVDMLNKPFSEEKIKMVIEKTISSKK